MGIEYVKEKFLNAMDVIKRGHMRPESQFQNKPNEILDEEFDRICLLYTRSTITGYVPFTQEERPYHNLYHVESCICEINNCVVLSDYEKSLLVVAIFYHDCSFLSIPTFAGQNEENSSMEAFDFLYKEFGLLASIVGRIVDIILATSHSDAFPVTNDDLFGYARDIDLASLGLNENDFIENSKRIRREYCSKKIDVYIENSIKFATKLLSRDKIYSMSIFADKYEDQARKNLKNYLNKLTSI